MNIDAQLNKMLLSFKIFPKYKGYSYIRSAVKLILEGSPFKTFKYEIYPAIAKEYYTNVACVEKNIINAIDAAWLNADIDLLRNEFGFTVNENRGKPTCREFILMLADKIRLADCV